MFCPCNLKIDLCFFGAFLDRCVHLDNGENSAIDNELDSKVKIESRENYNASFYLSLLTLRLEPDWQTLRSI